MVITMLHVPFLSFVFKCENREKAESCELEFSDINFIPICLSMDRCLPPMYLLMKLNCLLIAFYIALKWKDMT
jgi:hypothetical protein